MIRVFNEWRYRRPSLGVNKAFDSHRSVFSRMSADYLLKGRVLLSLYISALCKTRMVEGWLGQMRLLIAKISVFIRQSDRFFCVMHRSFLPWPVLPIAARVTE